jgi:hypothetical protein
MSEKTAKKDAKDAKDAPVKPLDDRNVSDGSVDRVGAVPRDPDGSPRLRPGFKLQLTEGATDAEKAAAWNLGGELPPEGVIEYVPAPHV